MKMSLSTVLDPTLELTKKLFWRVLGIFVLITLIEMILSILPFIGMIAQVLLGGILTLGLFLSIREAMIANNTESSLLDRTSHFAFKKETFITMVKFAICNFLIIFIGFVIPLYVVTYQLVVKGGSISQESLTLLFSSFDPLLIAGTIFGILYTLIVSGPAVVFAVYIGILKVGTGVGDAYRKSFLIFYSEWVLFLKLTLLMFAPLFFAMIITGIFGYISNGSYAALGLGGLLVTIYAFLLIPFSQVLRVVLVRELFEPKSADPAPVPAEVTPTT